MARILYLDLGMGAAGDMLTAALLELFPEPQKVVEELNALGLPGITYEAEESVKCGVTGTHMRVIAAGQEEGEEMYDAPEPQQKFDLKEAFSHIPSAVRKDVKAVYRLIAEAESHVHGMPIGKVHFHEVGSMDAIADVTAVCYLMRKLAPDAVIASPVNTGTGKVRCAHGILPVPAPATAYILQGLPTYDNGISSELCTPTGAALLKHFVTDYAARPVMSIEGIGYGMGKKDFEAANCVRAILGESMEARRNDPNADPVKEKTAADPEHPTDTITELVCNLDDMTAEEIGFALEKILDAGAVDVFTVPAMMKKNRPAMILHVLCPEENRETVVGAVFQHTTTIGIREMVMQRYILNRISADRKTPYGNLRLKEVSGYGVKREKYEYDDLKQKADEAGISLLELKKKLQQN